MTPAARPLPPYLAAVLVAHAFRLLTPVEIAALRKRYAA